MVDLSKLESEQVELKVENEYRRLKKNAYQREYYSKTVDENKRLKQNAYNRKWYAKNKRSKRMIANANQEQAARKVENKKPRTVSYPTTEEVWGQREHAGSSRPLARPTAASCRTGIRSIIIQVD